MINLLFGTTISIITTLFVLAMLAFIAITFVRRGSIGKWGRLILVFILVGTSISALSATRDGFATTEAVFAMMSTQALICAAAGALIFLTGLVSIFIKNQKFRRAGFHLISILFIAQVLTVEASRAILN